MYEPSLSPQHVELSDDDLRALHDLSAVSFTVAQAVEEAFEHNGSKMLSSRGQIEYTLSKLRQHAGIRLKRRRP